jgi:hypothetical protein
MAAKLRFLENRDPFPQYLETSLSRRNHIDLSAGNFISNRSRQTDGSGLIVSNGAVFDRNLHFLTSLSASFHECF